MAQSYNPTPGKLSLVTVTDIDGYNKELAIYAYKWLANEEPVDFTTNTCQGFRELDSGNIKTNTIHLTGVWDQDNNPFSDIPTMKLGDVDSILLQLSTGVTATAPKGIVLDWDISSVVDGLAIYSLILYANFTFEDFSGSNA